MASWVEIKNLSKLQDINHEFKVDLGKCMEIEIGGTKAVVAAIPLNK
ncbi:MAG: hypothetical protein K6F17_00560 [Lachnospiraceae bacterium]|nr:hypothetical protein [Lachnospiraceae bacterium]